MGDEKGSQQKHHTVKNITNVVVIRNSCFPYMPQEGYEKKATNQSCQYPFSFHLICI